VEAILDRHYNPKLRTFFLTQGASNTRLNGWDILNKRQLGSLEIISTQSAKCSYNSTKRMDQTNNNSSSVRGEHRQKEGFILNGEQEENLSASVSHYVHSYK